MSDKLVATDVRDLPGYPGDSASEEEKSAFLSGVVQKLQSEGQRFYFRRVREDRSGVPVTASAG